MEVIDQPVELEINSRQKAASALILRREARRSFRAWAKVVGHKPAKHHEVLIDKIQEVTDSPTSRFVIFLLPPGSAKSTYTSACFPSWYLGRRPGSSILACSYKYELAEKWGRTSRNLVQEYSAILDYTLKSDSKAAGEWETTNGGLYFCAGCNAGIAGYRADMGLIDDPIGNQEDADSKGYRDKQWDWFMGDFYPRLKPNASIIIIANRRHEDDLIGRLLSPETKGSPVPHGKWEVISIPFFPEENDILGRPESTTREEKIANRLWPEWFTVDMAEAVLNMPGRICAGLYQQRPAPEDGDYFKKDNLIGYTREELDQEERGGGFVNYTTSDFAVSEERGSDRHAHIPAGMDSKGRLWIFPDIFWKIAGPAESVKALLDMMQRRKPLVSLAEKGHISKSLAPYIDNQKREREIYGRIEEITPARAKDVRARTFQGMTEIHKIKFPKFATWWEKAEHELLTFPGGKNDDFVDAISQLCLYLGSMVAAQPSLKDSRYDEESSTPGLHFTMSQLKKLDSASKAKNQPRYQGR